MCLYHQWILSWSLIRSVLFSWRVTRVCRGGNTVWSASLVLVWRKDVFVRVVNDFVWKQSGSPRNRTEPDVLFNQRFRWFFTRLLDELGFSLMSSTERLVSFPWCSATAIIDSCQTFSSFNRDWPEFLSSVGSKRSFKSAFLLRRRKTFSFSATTRRALIELSVFLLSFLMISPLIWSRCTWVHRSNRNNRQSRSLNEAILLLLVFYSIGRKTSTSCRTMNSPDGTDFITFVRIFVLVGQAAIRESIARPWSVFFQVISWTRPRLLRLCFGALIPMHRISVLFRHLRVWRFVKSFSFAPLVEMLTQDPPSIFDPCRRINLRVEAVISRSNVVVHHGRRLCGSFFSAY